MKRLLTLMMVVAALTGCMSVPVSSSQAEPIPADDIRAGVQTTQAPGLNSEITIVRDSGGTAFGIAYGIDVKVDGTVVATMARPGTRFSMFLAPGLHTIQIGRRQQFMAGTQVTTQTSANTSIHVGESLVADEPMRIVIGDATPI